MPFEVVPLTVDLRDSEMKFQILMKDSSFNNETFTLTSEELDKMIVELKKARILILGLEAARKANEQALDTISKSEEVTAVRSILVDDLKKKAEELKA